MMRPSPPQRRKAARPRRAPSSGRTRRSRRGNASLGAKRRQPRRFRRAEGGGKRARKGPQDTSPRSWASRPPRICASAGAERTFGSSAQIRCAAYTGRIAASRVIGDRPRAAPPSPPAGQISCATFPLPSPTRKFDRAAACGPLQAIPLSCLRRRALLTRDACTFAMSTPPHSATLAKERSSMDWSFADAFGEPLCMWLAFTGVVLCLPAGDGTPQFSRSRGRFSTLKSMGSQRSRRRRASRSPAPHRAPHAVALPASLLRSGGCPQVTALATMAAD